MAPLDWDNIENMEYECVRCGRRIKGKELIFLDKLACPDCKCRVLRKLRSPVVKHVRAV